MTGAQKRILIQSVLFVVTFFTTTLAGAEWVYGKSLYIKGFDYTWNDFLSGLEFSIPFLLILTVHEFGHYLVARYYKVDVTLPYYLPFPPLPYSIGTFGAIIRMKSRIYSRQQNFDIGIAGPLAGFVMTMIVLFYGFTHLPEPEYIFEIHPEFKAYGLNYADTVYENQKAGTLEVFFGKNLVFLFFEHFVADKSRMPNSHEIMHYPLLMAGFLSLLFTWLNLLPIGQLDGGHVTYGLFGFKVHRIIATIFFVILTLYSGLGFINLASDPLYIWVPVAFLFLYNAFYGLGLSKKDTVMYILLLIAAQLLFSWRFPDIHGYSGWFVFILLLGRFIGIEHPPSEIEEELNTSRKILGWIALIIFVLCFAPSPVEMIIAGEATN